tara:strand:- start:32 stop:598 length:567 start_codon:yes stop_codon:yes gene_type:complete
MIESLSGFLASLKQTSPIIFAGLAIASGVLLFSGGSFVSEIGLVEFRDSNKAFIGACFLVSSSILMAQMGFQFFAFIKKRIESWLESGKRKKIMEAKKKDLVNLTPDEKAYLVPYILGELTTQYFLMEDGVKGSLEARGVLYRASSMGDMRNGWAYNVQSWARKYLMDNPGLLEGFNENARRHTRWGT